CVARRRREDRGAEGRRVLRRGRRGAGVLAHRRGRAQDSRGAAGRAARAAAARADERRGVLSEVDRARLAGDELDRRRRAFCRARVAWSGPMSPAPRIAAMTLGELLGVEAGRFHALPIRDLVLDSRDASAGSAFVAIRGTRDHGLKYAADALARGAEVVLYDPAETTEALHPVALGGAVESRSVAVPRLAARLGELARR